MVKIVPYEAFACPCGSGDVVLLLKTLSDVNFFYEKRNESVYWLVLLELQRLQFILFGSSSTLIYSPGSSTPPRYSSGASTSRNAKCSNCKYLLDKITVLEAT
ncbi:hypothetical protein Tco_1510197, partial [Tanacetum coccineum]